MQVARVLSLSLVAVLWAGQSSTAAEPWSPQKTRYYGTPAEPSAWEKLDAGAKKLFAHTSAGTNRFFVQTGEGTKRFLAGTRDALTWKRPAPRRPAPNSYAPWPGSAEPGRYAQAQKKKGSWFGSLFRRQEARPSESLEDFLSAERLDP